MRKLLTFNDFGRLIGENHPGAKLLDYEIDQVLYLLDAGFSYSEIADKFDVSKSCIAHIASGRRRGQVAGYFKRVSV
jgi:hypothetical protein